jgi:transposase-like protein
MSHEIENILKAFGQLNSTQLLYFKELILPVSTSLPDESFINIVKDRVLEQKPGCPVCGSLYIVKNGKNRLKIQCYKCRTCGRNYCDTTHTVLCYSKKSVEKWLEYMECMSEGISIRACAQKVRINRNTAFHWRHKILNAVRTRLSNSLKGIIEIDELTVSESFKGNHLRNEDFSMGRPSRKRGVPAVDRKKEDMVNVLFCKDRSGGVFSTVTGRRRASCAILQRVLGNLMAKGSIICTNNNPAFIGLSKKLNVKLHKLRHKNDVIKKVYHIKNVRALEEDFAEFLPRFNGVATKYLNHYVTWIKWLDFFKNCVKNYTSLYKLIDIFILCISGNTRLRVQDFKGVQSIYI